MRPDINEKLDQIVSIRITKAENVVLENYINDIGLNKSAFLRKKIKRAIKSINQSNGHNRK